jgi:hypothetical protein
VCLTGEGYFIEFCKHTGTVNTKIEQHEVLCYRRECIEQRIIFFSSRFFDRAPCTSVLLPEGKPRALIYLHIFKFVYLTILHASYLILKRCSWHWIIIYIQDGGSQIGDRVLHQIWENISHFFASIWYQETVVLQRCEFLCCNNQFYCQQWLCFKALFSIWFRCWLTESEIIGIRGAKVSCCKRCKKRTSGFFISFKVLLFVERNSLEACEGYFSFSRGTRKCAFRKNCCA